jgi:hypothetical protein
VCQGWVFLIAFKSKISLGPSISYLSLDSVIDPDIAIMSGISTYTITHYSKATENLAPALITIYTAPEKCASRWIQPNPTEAIAWSGVGDAYTVGVASPYYWGECVPYQRTNFSPGVCPSGQLPLGIGMLEYQKTDEAGRHTEWNALLSEVCCPDTLSACTIVD